MYEFNYNGRSSYVSDCIQLLYDAERDLLAIAKFLVLYQIPHAK